MAAGALVLAAALAGCGDSSASQPAASAQHTMPDGTVMEGAEHGAHGEHEHDAESHEHEGTPSSASPADASGGPSATASMVCGGDVAADVERLLGLDAPPSSSWSWSAPLFECTYDTPGGPVVLTVHDATDVAAGERWFAQTRGELAPTEPLRGIYGLGLPAFETGRGTTAFIRDGKTLVVDATAMPAVTGPEEEMDRGELAYAVATSVLACWTDHA